MSPFLTQLQPFPLLFFPLIPPVSCNFSSIFARVPFETLFTYWLLSLVCWPDNIVFAFLRLLSYPVFFFCVPPQPRLLPRALVLFFLSSFTRDRHLCVVPRLLPNVYSVVCFIFPFFSLLRFLPFLPFLGSFCLVWTTPFFKFCSSG